MSLAGRQITLQALLALVPLFAIAGAAVWWAGVLHGKVETLQRDVRVLERRIATHNTMIQELERATWQYGFTPTPRHLP